MEHSKTDNYIDADQGKSKVTLKQKFKQTYNVVTLLTEDKRRLEFNRNDISDLHFDTNNPFNFHSIEMIKCGSLVKREERLPIDSNLETLTLIATKFENFYQNFENCSIDELNIWGSTIKSRHRYKGSSKYVLSADHKVYKGMPSGFYSYDIQKCFIRHAEIEETFLYVGKTKELNIFQCSMKWPFLLTTQHAEITTITESVVYVEEGEKPQFLRMAQKKSNLSRSLKSRIEKTSKLIVYINYSTTTLDDEKPDNRPDDQDMHFTIRILNTDMYATLQKPTKTKSRRSGLRT